MTKFVGLPHKPSDEQKDIICADLYNKSFVVKASAGTGKSSVLEMITLTGKQFSNKRYIYIVFNTENAKEARARFPKNVHCTTANALGYAAVIGSNPEKQKCLVTDISVHQMKSITGAYKEFGSLDNDSQAILMINIIRTISNYCKTMHKDVSHIHVPADCALYLKEMVLGYARKYWNQASQLKCAITHEVYMKIWALRDPKLDYDTILYDEAQDANILMVNIINRQKASIIAVGDHYQQIYGFTGAVNALNHFDCDNNEFPLTQSYRYGPEIAGLANKIIYNNFGVEVNIKGFEQMDTRISLGHINADKPKTIIARTNITLLKLMVEAANDNKKFVAYLDTKEIRRILMSLHALKNNTVHKYHPEIKDFDTWDEFMTFLKNGGSPKLMSLVQMWGSIGPVVINQALKIAEECKKNYLKRNEKDLDYIFVSGHKSKGLEFDLVTISDDFVDPDDDEKEKYNPEETNLVYVATTRAKKSLDISESKQLQDAHNNVKTQRAEKRRENQ